MNRYNPYKAPKPDEWLAMGELERIELAEEYHRRKKIKIGGPRAHAAFHAAVENQVALGVPTVVETIERLQREGLDRHDALHACAQILAHLTYAIAKKTGELDGVDLNEEYEKRLKVLTAESWRQSG